MMLHYSTYVYPVMYTYKTRKNIFFFRLKIGLLILMYILGNACISIRYISEHCHIKKRMYIKYIFQMKTACIMFCDIISSIDTQ